jgi:hypothetical protein
MYEKEHIMDGKKCTQNQYEMSLDEIFRSPAEEDDECIFA